MHCKLTNKEQQWIERDVEELLGVFHKIAVWVFLGVYVYSKSSRGDDVQCIGTENTKEVRKGYNN